MAPERRSPSLSRSPSPRATTRHEKRSVPTPAGAAAGLDRFHFFPRAPLKLLTVGADELRIPAHAARVQVEETVRLTPLDIRSQRFAARLRGIDPGEVENFLHLVSEDYASLSRERDALAEKVRALEARVAELQSSEKLMRDTLVTAQSLAEDLRQTAIRESEVRVSEAEVKAEKVLDAAHRRASKLNEDIRELRTLRGRLAQSLRQTVETHLSLIDAIQDAADADLGEACERTDPRLRS